MQDTQRVRRGKTTVLADVAQAFMDVEERMGILPAQQQVNPGIAEEYVIP